MSSTQYQPQNTQHFQTTNQPIQMTNQPIQVTKQITPLENVNAYTQNSQFLVENHVQNQNNYYSLHPTQGHFQHLESSREAQKTYAVLAPNTNSNVSQNSCNQIFTQRQVSYGANNKHMNVYQSNIELDDDNTCDGPRNFSCID
jgi:hypothetical protein